MIILDETFIPDIKYLDKLLTGQENFIKKQWYVQRHSLLERITFRNKLFSDMKRLKYNIEFFKWFEYTKKLDDQKESLKMHVNK